MKIGTLISLATLAVVAFLLPYSEAFFCHCNGLHVPVCGSDGITYKNSCFADCTKDKRKPWLTHKPGSCPIMADPDRTPNQD